MSGWLEQEAQRMEALHRLKILDTPPEQRFDQITSSAQRSYEVEFAIFSIVDAHRQWFKSVDGRAIPAETPRSVAFCDHAIRQDDVFVIPDALRDPRYATNPLVTGDPRIRFYAGMPIREPSGFKIGTLCLIDSRPRNDGELDFTLLRELAKQLENELATDTTPEPALTDRPLGV